MAGGYFPWGSARRASIDPHLRDGRARKDDGILRQRRRGGAAEEQDREAGQRKEL
jgi:hypothetical protein